MTKILDKMLNFVGWETEEESEEQYDENEQVYEEEEPQVSFKASKPKNKDQQGKVVNLSSALQFKVVVIQPQNIDDAQDICDHLKNKKPVVVNLELLEKEVAQRIIDFLCGAVYALDGSIHKISTMIFLVAPNNVDVLGDFADRLNDDVVFSWMK